MVKRKGEMAQIGWVVRAKVIAPGGLKVSRIISKNFSSESAATLFASIAKKDVNAYLDVWVEKNYG